MIVCGVVVRIYGVVCYRVLLCVDVFCCVLASMRALLCFVVCWCVML